MRTVRFLTAASLLAALLIAGLTWAWWPRPVKTISFNCEQSYSHFQLNPVAAFGETDQLEIAMGGSSGTHWLLRGDRNFGPRLRPENEHALGFDPHGNFWFVRHAGNLTSPSFAAVATLNPARRSDDADYSLIRYDFLSGLEHRAVPVDRATFLGLTLSADRSTAAVAYGGDDSPLRIEIHDLPSGAVRRTMTFPDRIGSLAFTRKRVAAAGWMLSPNGDRFASGGRLARIEANDAGRADGLRHVHRNASSPHRHNRISSVVPQGAIIGGDQDRLRKSRLPIDVRRACGIHDGRWAQHQRGWLGRRLSLGCAVHV